MVNIVAQCSLPAEFSESQDTENFAISSIVLHIQDLMTPVSNTTDY
jgi:hypothetical protein